MSFLGLSTHRDVPCLIEKAISKRSMTNRDAGNRALAYQQPLTVSASIAPMLSPLLRSGGSGLSARRSAEVFGDYMNVNQRMRAVATTWTTAAMSDRLIIFTAPPPAKLRDKDAADVEVLEAAQKKAGKRRSHRAG